jgi:hypothetical protein
VAVAALAFVNDRELDLVRVGSEVHEELVDVVEHFRRAGVAPVDLVEGDDDGEPASHRLLEDVAGLRERPLGGVDEQQHGVDEVEASLHLAAEVGVAGRVHDVDPDARVVDRRLLGQDRDALLSLEVTRVHDPVHDGLVGPEGAGLAEDPVDERRLPVVDVGDDGDVPEVGADGGRGGGGGARRREALLGHGRADRRTSRSIRL